MDDIDFILKIVVVGESDVGKTSLMTRYTVGKFSENTSNTIGVDHFTMIKLIDDDRVKVSFWDTAGQERFRTMANAYYKDAHGVVLVYDVTDRESFTSLNYWLREIQKNCDDDVCVVILANKIDADIDDWQVSSKEGKAFVEKKGYLYGEVSAKENESMAIDKILEQLINNILSGNRGDTEFTDNQKEMIRFQKDCIDHSKKKREGFQTSGNGCCG